jgi:gamma-glutamyl-gamma-aminobutyrate hydrolase PuuD
VTAPVPPRIGLTTYRETATWGVWHEPADLLPVSYVAGITAAGGMPILLPPVASGTGPVVTAALDGVHGLLLTGGADIDPSEYDADRAATTGPARADRDGWELSLARAAELRGMPVLGVCRGMQVLAVVHGSQLVQHLPAVVGDESHCPVVGVHGRHDVRIAAGSRLAAIVGERTEVATYHHQAVASVAEPLEAIGWTDDGTIEALERPGSGWTVGVQWHPEVVGGEGLFDAFVAACRQWRDRTVPGSAAMGAS